MPPLAHADSAKLVTKYGEYRVHVFADPKLRSEVLVLSHGDVGGDRPVLTRIHSSCVTGDVFASLRCDCGGQLHMAMQRISREQSGLLIYLPQEGRGIGLANKIRAYALQDEGVDTVEANARLGFEPDARCYDCCRDIFAHFRVRRLRLMTNNPDKIKAMESLGFPVVERVALLVEPNEHNDRYLRAKGARLGHILDV